MQPNELIEGGQGRGADEVCDAGEAWGWCGAGIAIFVLVFLCGCVAVPGQAEARLQNAAGSGER